MPLSLTHLAVAARLTKTVCPARKPLALLTVTTLEPMPTKVFVMLLERVGFTRWFVPLPIVNTAPLGIFFRENFVEETPEPLRTTLLVRLSPEEIGNVPFPNLTAPPPAAET